MILVETKTFFEEKCQTFEFVYNIIIVKNNKF